MTPEEAAEELENWESAEDEPLSGAMRMGADALRRLPEAIEWNKTLQRKVYALEARVKELEAYVEKLQPTTF